MRTTKLLLLGFCTPSAEGLLTFSTVISTTNPDVLRYSKLATSSLHRRSVKRLRSPICRVQAADTVTEAKQSSQALNQDIRTDDQQIFGEVQAAVSSDRDAEENVIVDCMVSGGGPGGLLSAIMMAQKFPEQTIQVYERLSVPPSPNDEAEWRKFEKHYLIGLGGRGITALQRFGVWDDIQQVSVPVPGRKDWTPNQKGKGESDSDDGIEKMLTDRKFMTQVLPRNKLVSALHKHIVDNYSRQIQLHYGYDVNPVSLGSEHYEESNNSTMVLLEVSNNGNGPCSEEFSNEEDAPVRKKIFVKKMFIAADGSSRTIANQMELEDRENGVKEPFTVTRYDDDNERVFKSIGFKLPPSWRSDLNYSVRSKGGRLIFDALPANKEGDYVGVLLLQKDDEMARPVDPKQFRLFLEECLPQFIQFLDDNAVEKLATSAASKLPGFRFVGPRLHHNGRTVLLGDCAHTVKPYFGMGANSALEDVKVLAECIDESPDDFANAAERYSKRRAEDIKTLVTLSHSLDRPGTLGVFTFLIPVIMDAIFNKLAPQIFKPNIINMIQNEEITFQEAVFRKNLDRIGQLAIICIVIMGLSSMAVHISEIVGSLQFEA